MDDDRFQEGHIFEGRYRIVEPLGKGGFASVFRAIQRDLEREVAIKLLTPGNLDNSESPEDVTPSGTQENTVAKRFEREAKLLSKLKDPHTVTVFDYGQTEDNQFFMILEYVDGIDLDRLLAKEGSLPEERTKKIIEQILSSLQEAHAKGVLHRDLKPGNIMIYEHLGKTDQVKLIDFGIAGRIMDSNSDISQDLTKDQMTLGTPRYMAPERVENEELGPASDLYALGLITYEMLTGHKAVPGDSAMEVFGKQLKDDSVKLPADLDIHPEFRAIVDKLLQKPLENRFQKTSEVTQALNDVRLDRPIEQSESSRQDPPENSNSEQDKTKTEYQDTLNEPNNTLTFTSDFENEETTTQRILRTFPFWPTISVILLVQIGLGGYLILRWETSTKSSSAVRQQTDSTREKNAPNSARPEKLSNQKHSKKSRVRDSNKPNGEGNNKQVKPQRSSRSNFELIEPPPPIPKLEVRTIPNQLEIKVNGESVGFSPLALPKNELEFPMVVVAERPNGIQQKVQLQRFQSRVLIKFPEFLDQY